MRTGVVEIVRLLLSSAIGLSACSAKVLPHAHVARSTRLLSCFKLSCIVLQFVVRVCLWHCHQSFRIADCLSLLTP